jgi:hypothetical protein
MIVGLLGFIGSGKGTAGDILKGLGFEQVSFAKGVKDVAAEMFNWPRHLLEGDTEESREWREQPDAFWSKELGKPFTPRLALQLMGTEVGRDVFHKDFWVIKLKNYMKKNYGKNFVITDVRFENEIEFIREQGGILIEVQRGKQPVWYNDMVNNIHDEEFRTKLMEKFGIHPSEWQWVGHEIDYKIQNEGTLEDLQINLIKCLYSSYGPGKIDELNKELDYEIIN